MIETAISQRYAELAERMLGLAMYQDADQVSHDQMSFWKGWAASALNLIGISFGKDSTLYSAMEQAISTENTHGMPCAASAARGVFAGAKDDYNRGFATSLSQAISGEIFGDLLNSAHAALQEGYKDSAAVLAAAAFEDSLKKIGTLHGLDVAGKELAQVINALKGSQILKGGAGKTAEAFRDLRNNAFHAQWGNVSREEVASLIAFVREVVTKHLS